MYIVRANGTDKTAKSLNAAVAQLFGVQDAIVFSGKRVVAFWCSARNTVRPGFGADEGERKSIG